MHGEFEQWDKNWTIALLLETYLRANNSHNSFIVTHVVQKDQTGS